MRGLITLSRIEFRVSFWLCIKCKVVLGRQLTLFLMVITFFLFLGPLSCFHKRCWEQLFERLWYSGEVWYVCSIMREQSQHFFSNLYLSCLKWSHFIWCSIHQTSGTPETTASFLTLHTCMEWVSSCVSDSLGTQISSGRHEFWSLGCGPGYHPGTIDKSHLSSQLSTEVLAVLKSNEILNGGGPKLTFLILKVLMISLLPDPTHTTLWPEQTKLVLGWC